MQSRCQVETEAHLSLGTRRQPLEALPNGAGEILRPLWRLRSLILLATVMCGAASGLASARRAPLFEASARILVNGSKITSPLQVVPSEQLLPAMTTPSVAAQVIDDLSLTNWPPEAVLRAVAVRPVPLASYIDVVARTSVETQAVPMARRYAERAIEAVRTAFTLNADAEEAEFRRAAEKAATDLVRAENALAEVQRTLRIDALEREAESAIRRRAQLASQEPGPGTPSALGFTGSLDALTRLGAARAAVERLDGERRVAQRIHETLTARYEATVSAQLAHVPSLSIAHLDPTPRRLDSAGRDTLFGATAGLLFACAGVLVADVLRHRSSR